MATKKAAIQPTIRLTDTEGVYRIASKTYAGEFYTTDVRDTAHPTCDCFAGQDNFRGCMRDSVCWHVRAAEEFRADLMRWTIHAALVVTQPTMAPVQSVLIA